jgi:YbbR domain-containing protein
MRLLAFRPRARVASASEPPLGPPGPTPPWRRLRVPRPRELRELLRRNPTLKLFSLILAFLIWFTINVTGRDAEHTFELQVVPHRLAHDLIVTNPPRPVTVTIRGPRTLLDQIDEHATRISVDLTKATSGELRVDLNADMIQRPLGARLSVVRMEPARLKIRIERLARRLVPVRADLAGMPAFGYTVAESHVTPISVEAVGPASKIDELKEVMTEPIDLRGMAEALQHEVMLAWAGDLVSLSPDHVMVAVTLDQLVVSREFKRVDVRVTNAGGLQAVVSPAAIDLTVHGPQQLLHNFKIPDGKVFVDAAGLEPGTHRVPVKFDLPPALEVTRKQPEVVTLTISNRAAH